MVKKLTLFTIVFALLIPAMSYAQLRRVEVQNVCMVNNMDMGKPQTPVKVGELTYYGCCEMCSKTLNSDWKARFAKDPVTGSMVDKAKARIGAKPNGEALYFESEETFQAFGLR